MTTSLGYDLYPSVRDHYQETIGKLSFPRIPGVGTFLSSATGSSGVDEAIQQSSSHHHYPPRSSPAVESSVNNRGFMTTSSHNQHVNNTDKDLSTVANTGAVTSKIIRGMNSSQTGLNRHSDHVRSNSHFQDKDKYQPIHRSNSAGENSVASDGNDNIIEEKRKRTNGEGYTIHHYTRGKLLGKGGFAKVYLCTAMDTGKCYAVKVVPKANLVKARARQKLQAEIKIHRNLKHKHVCQYKHYFEDRNNCYILLELCHNQSMNEMIKRRKRVTEPEAAYFITQLLSAMRYMHDENVIHRDLKLGNLFLDKDMLVKVGDLGLATRLEDKDEKRKTICGTPNYIAPEIIQGDKAKRGHSFEVDIWSMGVILFTILVGKPPYEAKDVKATYQRILNNEYSFPKNIEVSDRAKDLIRSMLQSNPSDRPSLDTIEAHPFLTESDIPKFLPSSVVLVAPVWRLNDFGELVCTEPSHHEVTKKNGITSNYGRKPFAARDPNMPKATSSISSFPKPEKTSDINIEKIGRTALAAMTASNSTTTRNVSSDIVSPAFKIFDETSPKLALANKDVPTALKPSFGKSPRLTPALLAAQEGKVSLKHQSPQLVTTFETSSKVTSSGSQTSQLPDLTDELLTARTRALSINASNSKNRSYISSVNTNVASSVFTNMENDVDVLKKMADHIDAVLEVMESRKKVYATSPSPLISSRRGPPKWVTRYVDYTSKYGLGFLLNDASSGVYFNDSTKAALEADGDTFQYIERRKLDDDGSSRRGETVLETYSLDKFPEVLTKKVTLLQHFRNYLLEQQIKSDGDGCNNHQRSSDAFSRAELVYVKKWVRTKHAIMFFLSNKTVQVVFYDQTELLFTPDTAYLTYVDKQRERRTYNFTDQLIGSSAEIEKRLKYTKEIMVQLLSGHRS